MELQSPINFHSQQNKYSCDYFLSQAISSHTPLRNELICPKNVVAKVAMNFSKNEGLAPMAIEKIKILWAVLELPAKLHSQFSLFGPFLQ